MLRAKTARETNVYLSILFVRHSMTKSFRGQCPSLFHPIQQGIDLGFLVRNIVVELRMAAFQPDRTEHAARGTDAAADAPVRVDPRDSAAQTFVTLSLPGRNHDSGKRAGLLDHAGKGEPDPVRAGDNGGGAGDGKRCCGRNCRLSG